MRIVQLSDPHIVPAEQQPVHGQDTLERFRAAVNAVNRLSPSPDLVVMTGDQSNDGTEASYRALKDILTRLRFPCHMALGNHDYRPVFRMIMLEETGADSAPYYYSLNRSGYRIIVLDTQDEGEVSGRLDDDQLDWMEQELATGLPSVICMHHPPVPVGVAWMDELILLDNERFLHICGAAAALRLILCGHVHHDFRMDLGCATVLTAPSVGLQFRKDPVIRPDGSRVIATDEPAAFRIVDIDGPRWKTSIHQLSQ
ncbi:MAG: phosphodiesterase [Gemmatimonadetes bacterium]|nr:phosphodiesterase [Gemmatimonadota bacterium]MYG86268.1 phosphodiesterase [Gemmatimonadota bacterium]MYJ90232.1 phosphodiesterase [Gemmatimonadota bacterium]